jgi:hypothetical protein
MLLSSFTLLCLVDLILIHYVLWQIVKDILSLQKVTESHSLATYNVTYTILTDVRMP